MHRRIFAGLLAGVLVCSMASCANNATESPIGEDILTQTTPEKGKIPVTVLVKNAFSISTFEKEAEKQFPNLDIIQVGNYTSDMGINEYAARLEHDDLTDIVMTWPLDVGEEYWGERLIDLSSLPLSNKYTSSMLNSISRDGKLYYLPGPSQVRGIVYNKTLFKERGWEVPSDFEGFVTLCQTIEASGMRSLQLGLGNAEVLDTAFVGYSLSGSFAKPQDAQWLSDYNRGIGNFADHFAPALDTFQTLIDAGILKPEDLTVTYSDRERMMFTRKCAMVEDSVFLARMGESMTGTKDEFALMPFFNPGTPSDWARLYPVCYIGVNQHLSEEKNKQKYALVLELLEYISTPDGQQALSADTAAMFSSLNAMPPPNDVPEISALLPALSSGRSAVFPTLKNAQSALREGLAGMVAGTMTKEELARTVDLENNSPPVARLPLVLGTATKDFTLIETGNFITDTMREHSGCEIALFLDNGKDGEYNGKGVSARLYGGDVTDVDLRRIYPDTKLGETGALWKISMTGENLLKTLEYSIEVDNSRGGWFYYFSGLKVEFAPTAQPGSRIKAITDSQGNQIDPLRSYSIAVMEGSVPENLMESCEKTELLIPELLAQTVKVAGTISPSGDGRFVIREP